MKRFGSPLLLISFALAGCASHADRGAAIGGLGGAGVGALIGEASGHGAEGALLGAAVGALGGAAIGNTHDQREAEMRARMGRQMSGAVTAGDVVAMVQSGVSEEVIATHIRTNGVQQRVQPGDLITLRNQGVSDYLINAMQTAPVGGAVAVQPGYAQPVYAQPATVIVQEHYGPPVVYGPPRHYWRPHYHCPPPRPGFSVEIGGHRHRH
jgi:hypothetical protein